VIGYFVTTPDALAGHDVVALMKQSKSWVVEGIGVTCEYAAPNGPTAIPFSSKTL